MVILVVVVFRLHIVEQEQVFVVPNERLIRNHLRLISAVQSHIMLVLKKNKQKAIMTNIP